MDSNGVASVEVNVTLVLSLLLEGVCSMLPGITVNLGLKYGKTF